MSLTGALILFGVFIVFYVIIVAFFTMLFRLTGMTEDKARTQVISMLTNCGFTTKESETILSSRQRRRLAQITILFGYSFTVIIVSLIINLFLALNRTEMKKMIIAAPIITAVCVFFFFFTRNRFVRSLFDRLIKKIGSKVMRNDGVNPVVLIDTYGQNVLAEVLLTRLPAFLDGKKLGESGLKENYGVQIMLIKSDETSAMVDGNTILKEKDVLVVFGDVKKIRYAFENTDSFD